MLHHPDFNPVAIQLGPIAVHWYGLMYLFGFAAVWVLGRYRIHRGDTRLNTRQFEDLVFYCILGVILGGRLGYVLFYKPQEYLAHPLHVLYIWEGGMAFHGGLLGVIVALLAFAKINRFGLLELGDFIAPMIPLGLAAGRLGNFINGELWGRVSDVPWAMVFPQAGDGMPRHPSQLYEMALEGIVLFVVLWTMARRPLRPGLISAVFLTGYGVLRFGIEFTREPDAFLGLLWAGLSMGQWLSLPMIAAGVVIALTGKDRPNPVQ